MYLTGTKVYYTYKHITLNGIVFYVGQASYVEANANFFGKPDANKFSKYKRAYRNPFSSSDNSLWQSYASKIPYRVVIDKEYTEHQPAIEREAKLISMYGMLYDATGTLVNVSPRYGLVPYELISKQITLAKL